MAVGNPTSAAPSSTSKTGSWIVRLDEPSLAAHQAKSGRINARSAEARTYTDRLAARQSEVAKLIGKRLGRKVTVTSSFRNVLNAIVIKADAAEAGKLAKVAGVAAVEPEEVYELTSDASHEIISSPAVWAGETGPELATRGEGTVVGILDSGINAGHPAFAATDGEGYTHTNPYGRYLGVCDPTHPNHDPICNDKLVGAYSFVSGNSARDTNGHGSHTASTAAGNRHQVTLKYGPDQPVRTVQGVAPRANVVMYRVCVESCPVSSILAGINQAVVDGVDVLNYSISGADRPWADSVSRAFLEAFGAGIFVAASAGNSGPGAGTVAHTSPWNASVAATTTDRTWVKSLSVVGPTPVPPALANLTGWPGFGPGNSSPIDAELRYSGEVGTATGCSAFPAGSFAGAIALIPLGTCTSAIKITNAASAGAAAAVLFERQPGPPVFLSGVEKTTIPAISVTQADGEALQSFATATAAPVTARLGATTELARDAGSADLVAWFSSRGPSDYDLLAPTLAAPGVNILAAYREVDGDPNQYNIIRGTSMASPHVAGAGALLAALHPDWSPAQIRAALAGTADPEGVREGSGTPADPLDAGAGRLDLAAAGRVGLVMDESYANMLAANPATGGVPRELNVPYLVNQQCNLSCSWTRTVTNVADTTATYSASVTVPAGLTATVTPATFTLAPGASQQITVDLNVSGSSGGSWTFADLRVTTDGHHANGAAIAGVHYPVAVIPVAPGITVDPTKLEVTQKPGLSTTRSVTIRSTGNGALKWQLAGGDGCVLPDQVDWLSTDTTSGTLNPNSSTQLRFTLDSTDKAPGKLQATLCVASNDPAKPSVPVTVTLVVSDLPTMEVTPELAVSQPAGTVTGTKLTIGNTGTAPLEWTVGEAPVVANRTTLATTDPKRRELLRNGVLLVPNTALPGVAAFDPQDGDLLEPAFITYPPETEVDLGTTTHIILNQAQDGFLVSSQSTGAVYSFDLDGKYQGVHAPVGGPNPGIMGNVRGMTLSPSGTLLVASGSGNKVVEFDAKGNYLRDFITSGSGGISGPWYLTFRENDLLVSASGGNIYRYDHSGQPLSVWEDTINFPQQMYQQENGNILAAAFSSPPGVWEIDPNGAPVNRFTGALSNRGVHPLGNGNILTTNSGGVHEIDRGSTLVETPLATNGARMISEIARSQPCDEPADVAWLRVAMSKGKTPAGGSSKVTVLVDSTGLTPGVHEAHLCVAGNDPDSPLLGVPVKVTVTDQACARTITGAHPGPLTASAGLTCLAYGSSVAGKVTVAPGASLHTNGANIGGAVSAERAAGVELSATAVVGAINLSSGTGPLSLTGNHVTGLVSLTGNNTGPAAPLVSGNTVVGPLKCSGNEPPPVNGGVPNTVSGVVTGQCRGL
ncbi:S8 family serine peptidase [Micromonospora echinofusca]|uniref:S8 family serine peptidase n=1 Tax=Micromonospora echinofusca TaxID=47858 RepID=UPI00343B30C7